MKRTALLILFTLLGPASAFGAPRACPRSKVSRALARYLRTTEGALKIHACLPHVAARNGFAVAARWEQGGLDESTELIASVDARGFVRPVEVMHMGGGPQELAWTTFVWMGVLRHGEAGGDRIVAHYRFGVADGSESEEHRLLSFQMVRFTLTEVDAQTIGSKQLREELGESEWQQRTVVDPGDWVECLPVLRVEGDQLLLRQEIRRGPTATQPINPSDCSPEERSIY